MDKTSEDALKAGANIAGLVENTKANLILAKDLLLSRETGAERFADPDTPLGVLRGYWERLQEYRASYPDSAFVSEMIDEVLRTAEGDLPQELYRDIYQSDSTQAPE